MIPFAEISLDPVGLVAWLVVGLVVGWLAGRMMKGGYGVIGDMMVGLVGAVVGGLLFGILVPGIYGLLGSIVPAFVGACLLIAIVRLVTAGLSRR